MAYSGSYLVIVVLFVTAIRVTCIWIIKIDSGCPTKIETIARCIQLDGISLANQGIIKAL